MKERILMENKEIVTPVIDNVDALLAKMKAMKKFKVIEGNRLLNPERILAGGGIGNIGTLCPTGNHAVLCQYTHGTCNQGQTNYSSEPCYGGGTYHTCGMWAAYDVNCNGSSTYFTCHQGQVYHF